MIKRLNTIVICFFLVNFSLLAQQGKVDPLFNTFDDGTDGEGFDGSVRVVIENINETSYIAGDFLNFNGTSATRVIKLDAFGDSDLDFISGTGFDNSVTSGFKTVGNKLLYGGSFLNYNGVSKSSLLRLNLDGTLDVTFNVGDLGPNNAVQALAQFSDGSIIVAGDAITKYNAVNVNNIFKIDADGVLDTSFNLNINAGTAGAISKVCIQSDGKILICGSFTSFNGVATRGLARLNVDGTLDTTFHSNLGTGSDNNIIAMDLQSDNKIILGGALTSFNGLSVGRIIRLNVDGTIDISFNNSKEGFVNGIVQVLRFTNDGIYVGGSFTGKYNGEASGLNRFTLLKNNGDLDLGFDTTTGLPSCTFYTVETSKDAQVYIGGSFTTYDTTLRGRLAKVNKSGNLDVTFMSAGGVGANGTVLKVIPLNSKKSMIFGSFTRFNGINVNRIARLNEDGSLDTSFNTSGVGPSSTIRTAVQLSDGSFIIGGDFTSYNGVQIKRILKINSDGILDTSFSPDINGSVYAIVIDANNKVLVGGNFDVVGGVSRNRLVRLNSNGSIDLTFNPDVDKVVQAISLEATGSKIIVAGDFLTFNGVAVSYLVRINSDGTLDSSYNNTNGPNNAVYSLARQSSGELLIGGSFTTFAGTSKRRFVRLTNSGNIDTSFNMGIGFNNQSVRTITVQQDDRIILGGQFNGTFTGIDNIANPVRRIVRLNSDGSYNSTFKAILNGICYTSAIDAEGRIMIGGTFSSISGIAKYRVARILACMDSTTYTSSGWTRGLPDKKFEVGIEEDLTLNADTNFCNCSVSTGKKLTVDNGKNLTLEFDVFGNATTKNGKIEFNNFTSLLQNDMNSINTGDVIYNRFSSSLNDYDYVYWSSPLMGQTLESIFPGSDKMWYYESGKWIAASGAMLPAKGYIVRYTSLPTQDAVFVGKPNNGDYSIALQSTGSNLIGNPYPSSIDAKKFMAANGAGTLYFWTHNTDRKLDTNGTKYIYSADDYASFNDTGGVQATSKGFIPDGTIGAGQSFFVETSATSTFTFTNEMRISDSGKNSQFFKQTNTKRVANKEMNRIWLNLANDSGAFKQLLVGYVAGATNDFDISFDGTTLNGNAYVDFYSIDNSKNYTIQGRGLPFDNVDQVPLGYKSDIEGLFQITIDKVDGDLVNQSVYLEDKITNTIHNLKNGSYSFTTAKGTFNDRFVLRYKDTSKLGTAEVGVKEKGVIVSVKNSQIKINSFDQTMASVKVYDLKGSLIYEKHKINKNEFIINHLSYSNQFLIVMSQLENGKFVSEEIIFHN